MVVILIEVGFGDEVIMLFYIFVLMVNVFVLCGVMLVFVDICCDILNFDESFVVVVINECMCVIVLVYYVGVFCEMDVLV